MRPGADISRGRSARHPAPEYVRRGQYGHGGRISDVSGQSRAAAKAAPSGADPSGAPQQPAQANHTRPADHSRSHAVARQHSSKRKTIKVSLRFGGGQKNKKAKTASSAASRRGVSRQLAAESVGRSATRAQVSHGAGKTSAKARSHRRVGRGALAAPRSFWRQTFGRLPWSASGLHRRLSKLPYVSNWRAYRATLAFMARNKSAMRRVGLGAMALLIISALAIEVSQPQQVEARYVLSPKAQQLIGEPNESLGQLLRFNAEQGMYLYNEGYMPSEGVTGQLAGAKFSAAFPVDASKDVVLNDTVNQVSIKMRPLFEALQPQQDNNRLIYPLKGRDAQKIYTLSASGVKEDIVLESIQGDELSFTYQLELPENTEARSESNGSLGIYGVSQVLLGDVKTTSESDAALLEDARRNGEKSQLLYTLPAPFTREFNSKTSQVKTWYDYDQATARLTLHAANLKQASYPLTIDPTVYIETAQALMLGNNETNIDFDVDNQLIQKSQTTGARIDSWLANAQLSEPVWGHATAAASGYVYRTGGRTADTTTVTPPIVESSIESLQSSNSVNFTMSMPGTRPAGDLYVAVMCHDGETTSDDVSTAPAGWTEITNQQRNFAAYYKIGTDQGGGNEAASYTWSWGSSEKAGGAIMRISNFDQANPVTVTPTVSNGFGVPSFPAITPSANNSLVIRATGADDDEPSNTGWVPAGHTKISSGGPTGWGDCAYAAAAMDPSPAGGVSTGTTSLADGSLYDTWGAMSLVVNADSVSGAPAATVDTVEWAEFNPNTLQIESPNPGTGNCPGPCNNPVYNLPEPRTNHSMVIYNGYIYVIGGEDAAGVRQSTVYIAKIGANGEPQLWHPTNPDLSGWDYWYEDTGLNGGIARNYLSAVAYNNRMYIVGGQTDASAGGVTTVERADILPNGKLANWTTVGMQSLPAGAGRHMADVVVYNDTLYTIGGFEGAASSSANLRDTVFYSKLEQDGTMNPWQSTTNFTGARANFGGIYSYIWGAYIYMGGGCRAVNGNGNCTTLANDMQLATINADGSLGEWTSVGNLDNTRIGYSFLGWQGGLYRLGGCTAVDPAGGECTNAIDDVDYGVINPAGEVSTVSITDEDGEGTCVGGSPYNCDLPPVGDGAGQGGQMLSMSVVLNGYLYVIGGCTNFSCSQSSGNVSYVAISSDGSLQKPDVCPTTSYGAWCVDSTNKVNGNSGVSAAGVTVFNNRIYLVGGIDETTTGTQRIYYNDVEDDGSLNGPWESVSFAAAGMTNGGDETGEKSYTYAYARANPASAGTSPGNLFVIGGCSSFSASAGCSNSYNSSVYKCNISTTGSVSGCDRSGQLQLDVELASESNQGLGLHSGTVYANYIYLIGGYSVNVGDRATVFYARFDDNNNIVDAESGTADINNPNDDWIESDNTLSIGRRRGFAFGYNGHIYAVGGYNNAGAGIIPFIEWAKEDVSDGSVDPFITSSVTINQRWGLSMAVSNSYAYVVGGCDVGPSPGGCSSFEPSVQTFQLYNNSSGTPASYGPSANQFGSDRYGASSLIHNGYIYLAGGCTDTVGDCSGATADVQYASLDAQGDIGNWSSTAAGLPAARGWGHLEEAGGTLYWIGGQDAAGDEKSEVYFATPSGTGDIASWGTASNGLPADRTQFGAASWNDRLYVVAGLDDSGTETNTVLISPDLSGGGNITSPWATESTNTPDVARSGNTVVAYANNLYSFGGHDGSSYLLDSQFTQINADGSLDEWTFTTPLPNVTRQADGFAANGYMYIVGGRSEETVCDSNTYVAPISANTTIATGNNPTGVGEWNETNVRYAGERYGNAVAYDEGRLYVLGGGCLSTNETVFDSPGAAVYPVPAGVSSITVKMWGAGGGGAAGGTRGSGGSGGGGGFSQATLAVTPAENLDVYVGGAGGAGAYVSASGGGGGGGGHSEVSRAGTNLLIAAGGGGGGGGDNSSFTDGGAGGAGGGSVGVAGSNSSSAGGGGAGTNASGGAGGSGGQNSGSGGGFESAGDGANGTSGLGGQDNGGIADDGDGGTANSSGWAGGGGGGGGLYGGGGGGSSASGDAGGGGGGGGSNYLTGSSQINSQGSGATPGNSGDPARVGAGAGGLGGSSYASGLPGTNGRVIISYAGANTMTMTGADRTTQTSLLSQPQLAKYSRMIDTDSDVFPTRWLMNGLDNSIGARWTLRYRSMHDLDALVAPNEDCGTTPNMPTMATWGQDTNFGDVTLGQPENYIPLDGGGGNINCARYFYFSVGIDASQTFGYPEDVNRGPTIADLSLFYVADPSKRLLHGKSFNGGLQQPLDTPFW